MSSSDSGSSFNYDRYGEPSDRNRIGNGSAPFTSDTYVDYKVSISGKEYVERHWNSGQIHRKGPDGGWNRVK